MSIWLPSESLKFFIEPQVTINSHFGGLSLKFDPEKYSRLLKYSPLEDCSYNSGAGMRTRLPVYELRMNVQ